MKSLIINKKLERLLRESLKEDVGSSDWTSSLLIDSSAQGKATIIAKEPGIFCGSSVISKLSTLVDKRLKTRILVNDGSSVRKQQKVMELRGSLRSILKFERTALNYLGHLSGVSTVTRNYVKRVKKYGVKILDTRKTTPLLREFEKYAVRAGGGCNHRMGLYDQIFVKENHRIFGELSKLQKYKNQFVIEIRNRKELEQALLLKPAVILFDNFKPAKLKELVRLARCKKTKAKLEASGGMNLKNVSQYARTGIDQISVGAITHSVPSLDFSLLVEATS